MTHRLLGEPARSRSPDNGRYLPPGGHASCRPPLAASGSHRPGDRGLASIRKPRITAALAALCLAALAAGCEMAPPLTRGPDPSAPGAASPAAPSGDRPQLSVRVDGNRLVDGNGSLLRLLGVNRPGMDVLTP